MRQINGIQGGLCCRAQQDGVRCAERDVCVGNAAAAGPTAAPCSGSAAGTTSGSASPCSGSASNAGSSPPSGSGAACTTFEGAVLRRLVCGGWEQLLVWRLGVFL